MPQIESLIAQNWPKRFSLNFVSTLSTPFRVFLQNLKKFLCLGTEIWSQTQEYISCHFGNVQSQNSFLPQIESLIAQNWPERFSLNFKVFLQNLKKFLCLGAEISFGPVLSNKRLNLWQILIFSFYLCFWGPKTFCCNMELFETLNIFAEVIRLLLELLVVGMNGMVWVARS